MGSDNFVQQVFEKVFDEDIVRLRSMEDMWKSRQAPEVLRYTDIDKEASELSSSIASEDQRQWGLAENFKVFSDRQACPLVWEDSWLIYRSLQRLSERLQRMQAETSEQTVPAILTFDKDDEDCLDFVTASANLRSIVFGIETRSKFDTKRTSIFWFSWWHALTRNRDGRQHNSRNCYNKCYGSRIVRFAGF